MLLDKRGHQQRLCMGSAAQLKPCMQNASPSSEVPFKSFSINYPSVHLNSKHKTKMSHMSFPGVRTAVENVVN